MGLFDFFCTNVAKLHEKNDVSGLIKALKHDNREIRRSADLPRIFSPEL